MQENNREISVLKKRILKYLDFKGVSKYECYQKTGITNGVFSQKNGMSEDNLMRFLSYFVELNPDWLLTGVGPMEKIKRTEMQISLGDSAPINAEIQVKNSNNKGDSQNIEQKNLIAVKSNLGIPLVGVHAVAGFGNADFSIQESDVKDYYVVPKFKDKHIDFMIEVSGSSMQPKYNSGDVVACTILKESRFIQWGKVHVIATTEQGLLIKRLYPCESDDNDSIKCQSDNERYLPFNVLHNEITGIALVVGVIRLE
jgi:phage repressor protein C with HTH and peptisase S24 domain